jgi:serine/threonine protein phosphatase PrpC
VKINQDSISIKKKILDNPNFGFYAVCDGHGLYGHKVSKFVARQLPSI